jgi:hypothetical protein
MLALLLSAVASAALLVVWLNSLMHHSLQPCDVVSQKD